MQKTTTKLAILFGLMVFLSGCEKQSKTQRDLLSVSPDSVEVRSKLQRIDALVEQAISSRATPSAIVLVALRGQGDCNKAYGNATLAEPKFKNTKMGYAYNAGLLV